MFIIATLFLNDSSGSLTTAVSTDLTKNILLIDQHDVHAFDIDSAETTVDLNSYNVKTIHSKTDV